MQAIRGLGSSTGRPHTSPPASAASPATAKPSKSNGIEFDDDLVRTGDWWQESGTRHTTDLLALPTPPTALFCGNDWMAMGAYDAVREAGLRIPDDMAIVGFDNRVEIADHMRPRLSTIALPYHEMGGRAVELLLESQSVTAAATELISCPFVQRSSV